MDFTDVIKARRSIRRYKPNTVPEDALLRILKAGRLAPTWANMQGVRYVVIKDTEKINAICQAVNQKWLKNIPLLIAVCCSPSESGRNSNNLEYFPVDAAICMEHIILAATNEGLGTCWIGYFDEPKIKETLKIPKRTRVIGLTPLGYPAKEPRPQSRIPLRSLMFLDRYKNHLFKE